MRTLLTALTALLLFATPVVAGDYEDALAAYNASDYQKAFQLWKPLAEQGDASAQAMVGFFYAQGLSVPKDKLKSIYWNTKAAEQGHAIAQHNLASTYADAKDYTKSIYWARKAAEQGLARSQGLLAFAYQDGQGLPQNDVKAAYWFRKGAEQGSVPSQYKVGHYYYLGKGLPQDNIRAYAWWAIAATQGDKSATKTQSLLKMLLTPEQISEAQKLSSELWDKYVVPFQKD